VVAMRYWHPSTEEAIAELKENCIRWTDSAAALPAVFLRDHAEQLEGMEPALLFRWRPDSHH